MAFTPLVFSKIDGLGVYAAEPIVEDSYDRGSLKGKRVETVTYVFEREGSFEIPEIAIWWWDIGRKALRKVVLSSLRAAVSGEPANADDLTIDDAVEGSGQTGIQMLLGGIVCLLLLAGGAWRFRSPLKSRWQAWKYACEFSEKAYFHRFGAAYRQYDAKASYNRLLAWLNRQSSGDNADSLRQFLAAAGSQKLDQQVEELESRLFKIGPEDQTQTTWSGLELYSELTRCRTRLMRTRPSRFPRRGDLVELNPG